MEDFIKEITISASLTQHTHQKVFTINCDITATLLSCPKALTPATLVTSNRVLKLCHSFQNNKCLQI